LPIDLKAFTSYGYKFTKGVDYLRTEEATRRAVLRLAVACSRGTRAHVAAR
jgi:hypothetical protein